MTNKKVTRRALLMSVTSLLICISMLLGTTFAWFTDEVTSGVNQIVAGNLDVELEHQTDAGFVSVTDADNQLWQTAAFSGPTLWEPGAMAIETFKVTNKGTLALKYLFNVNPLGDDAYSKVIWSDEADARDLTDVIKMVVTSDRPATREAAAALFTDANTKTLSKNGGVTLQTAALEPGAGATFTVILYWPAGENTLDNRYNLKNSGWSLYSPASSATAITEHDILDSTDDFLYIKPSVTLLATQQTSEADSFDNQYDAGADTTANAFTNVTVSAATTTGNVTTDTSSTTPVSTATLTTGITPAGSGNTEVQITAIGDSSNNALGVNSSTTSGNTTTTVANSANLVTETKDPGESSFVITGDDIPAAVIDLTLTVVTTTTTTVTGDTPSTTTTESSKQVSNGFTALVKTYVDPGLGDNVKVVYPASSDSSVAFSTGYTSTKVDSEAAVDAVGEFYYNNTTGYLVFMTDHFSEYVVTTNAVAKNTTIGAYYDTLQAAVDEAKEGETVIPLKNFTLSETLTIAAGKNLTLDLNGKTLTASCNAVTNNGTLTIKNGTIEIPNAGTNKWYAILNEGTQGGLTVSNVTINSTSGGIRVKHVAATISDCDITINTTATTYAHGIYSSDGANVTVNSGTYSYNGPVSQDCVQVSDAGSVLTIKGGTFTSAPDANTTNAMPKVLHNHTIDAVLNIEGGSFSGDIGTDGTDSAGMINISGGTFTITDALGNISYYSISGGTFNDSIKSKLSPAIVEGKSANDNSDGTWTVVEFVPEIIVTKDDGVGDPTLLAIDTLAGFRDAVDGGETFAGYTVTVQKDISLGNVEWNPIGSKEEKSKPFSGIFDGNNKTISGLYIQSGEYVALFSVVYNGTVKNLTVSGNVSGTNASGIVARLYGGTVKDCVNKVNVYSSDAKAAGVTVHAAGYNGSNARIEGCTNEGTISSSASGNNHASGIVAQMNRGLDVVGCNNTGTITHSGNGNGNSGLSGIGGWASNISNPGFESAAITISNCTNTGTLNNNGSNIFSGQIYGGSSQNTTLTVSGCTPDTQNTPQP